jgi:phosphatidylinositol 4-kinase B
VDFHIVDLLYVLFFAQPILSLSRVEFMIHLHQRLHRARSEWATRLDDFTSRLGSTHGSRSSTALSNPLIPITPFRVLCLLFAYEDVLDNGKLDAAYDLDDGVTLTFFVPQLLSFLLHGALYTSPQLEEWILDTCRRNIYFAHRCYWFLRAWCLEVPVNAPPTPSILSRNNSDSALMFLDEPAAPQSKEQTSYDCGSGSSVKKENNGLQIQTRQRSNPTSDKFLPEERALIERLMLRVKECGEAAAKVLEYGTILRRHTSANGQELYESARSGNDSAPSTPVRMMGSESGDRHSPSELIAAVEVRHLDCVSSVRRYGFLALDLSNNRFSPTKSMSLTSVGETNCFDRTPQFLDSLVYIAEALFFVPREKRKDELQRQLRALECELLPSNSVYLPVNNVHHRVWRIVSDESIPLNTKERVPCIVCMEVIDHNPSRRRLRSWSILRHSIRRTTSLEQVPSEDSDRDPDPSCNMIPMDSPDNVEEDILHKWRFEKRDPMRRVSIIDKMASTVKETVKGPLDKVKTQFNQLKDRAMHDELRSLTQTETLIEQSSRNPNDISGISDTLESLAERGLPRTLEESDDSSEFRSLSRTSSSSSFVSMGQWSSPHPSAVPGSKEKGNNYHKIRRSPLAEVRRKLEREAKSGGSTLLYGSDEERERISKNKRQPHIPSGMDSLSTSDSLVSASSVPNRPPQVVFRESWKSMMERLRSKSVYGNHPGWRLLPVLIKANDDLRQEQLASQLIYRMATILAREKVPAWLCPYEIIALTDRGGIIECVPDTISLDSLKRNNPHFTSLRNFFVTHYGEDTDELADAKANFVESLAAYSIVCFLLQLKDRHNGNILLDAQGHIVHIDFGFFFLSSPGKNVGFESAPFKLTREFVEVLEGPNGRLFRNFRELCVRAFIALRRHCMEIILLVEMLKVGNEELPCFRGRPDFAIQQLKDRFRLDLNDRACREYVNSLVDDSIENWRTDWYDRYQRYFVGVL